MATASVHAVVLGPTYVSGVRRIHSPHPWSKESYKRTSGGRQQVSNLQCHFSKVGFRKVNRVPVQPVHFYGDTLDTPNLRPSRRAITIPLSNRKTKVIDDPASFLIESGKDHQKNGVPSKDSPTFLLEPGNGTTSTRDASPTVTRSEPRRPGRDCHRCMELGTVSFTLEGPEGSLQSLRRLQLISWGPSRVQGLEDVSDTW